MSITAININYSNGQGGHTATVTEILGAQDPEQVESLGEVIGDFGNRSSFSHTQIDELMNRFVLDGKNKSVDPIKTTVTRQYIDRTSAKLNNYVVLVRGINASPVGGLGFEGNLPYFGEVKGSFAASAGAPRPQKIGNCIILGYLYNFNTRATKDGTKISLVYQSKELVGNLSQNAGVVAAGFMEEPNLGEFSLKYGYTLSQYLAALNLANIQYDFPDVEDKNDVLFETSGTLASVTSSIASFFGLYFYVNPEDGVLKFINSIEAAALEIEDPTLGSDPNVTNATFSTKAIPEVIINTYAGTGEKPESTDAPTDSNPLLFATMFKRVFIEQFDAFKNMNMSWPTIGCFFSLFNQDQSTDIFNKFTFILMVLAERNTRRNGRFPMKKGAAGQNLIYAPNEKLPRIAGYDIALDLQGHVERNKITLALEKIINPLYLPIPKNKETWEWGPVDNPHVTAIWPSDNVDGALESDVAMVTAQHANKSHEFRRTRQGYGNGRSDGKTFSAAKYFNIAWEKTDVQLEWEAKGMDNNAVAADREEKEEMAMPMPSESNLYEFLKCFFQIGGGVYVSNGYGRMKSLTMAFENSNNITVSGPHHKNMLLRDIEDIEPLNNFLRVLDIGEFATVKQLAELTNGKAQVVGDFFFIAIRQLALFEKINDPPALQVAANEKADFGPLGSHIEFYRKYGDSTSGKMHFVGGKINKEEDFYQYIGDLAYKSRTAFGLAIGALGRHNLLKCYYQRSEAPIEEEDDDKLEEDDNVMAGGGAEGEQMDLHDKYDSRFYDVVNPVDPDAEPEEDQSIYMKPALSAATGTTIEMKALRSARGDEAEDFIYSLKTSSKTVYGLDIPAFKPTMSSISITVGSGGIQTTIGESTLKIIPPDQQYIVGRGVEAMVSNIVSSRFNARQKNYLGL